MVSVNPHTIDEQVAALVKSAMASLLLREGTEEERSKLQLVSRYSTELWDEALTEAETYLMGALTEAACHALNRCLHPD
jgi:hypothetical protein